MVALRYFHQKKFHQDLKTHLNFFYLYKSVFKILRMSFLFGKSLFLDQTSSFVFSIFAPLLKTITIFSKIACAVKIGQKNHYWKWFLFPARCCSEIRCDFFFNTMKQNSYYLCAILQYKYKACSIFKMIF